MIFTARLFAPAPAQGQGLTFTQISTPTGNPAAVTGVNDSNVAVGYYQDYYQGSNTLRGFTYQNGTFTNLDGPLPNANTVALAINNAGTILIGQGQQQGTTNFPTAYFMYSGGTFTPIGLRGVVTATGANFSFASLSGLNDKGEVVGLTNGGQAAYGMPALGDPGTTTFPTTRGNYTQFNCSAAQGGLSRVGGINNTEQVTGSCVGSKVGGGFVAPGFIYNAGQTTTFYYPAPDDVVNNPNNYNTQGNGINDSGLVAGQYQFTQDLRLNFKGFIYDGSQFTLVVPPDASASVATGINNNGVIVGDYQSMTTGEIIGFITSPLVIKPGIQITTKSLPTAAVGLPYDSGQLTATGGSGSYGWTLTTGTLPSGFSLLPTGKIVAPSTSQASPGSYSLRIFARQTLTARNSLRRTSPS